MRTHKSSQLYKHFSATSSWHRRGLRIWMRRSLSKFFTVQVVLNLFQDNGTASPAASPGGWKWGSWRIPSEYLPLLVGAVCGGALILLMIIAAIVWRCCVVPRRDKAYCKSFLLYIYDFKTWDWTGRVTSWVAMQQQCWLMLSKQSCD